jgi:hypothetical protein
MMRVDRDLDRAQQKSIACMEEDEEQQAQAKKLAACLPCRLRKRKVKQVPPAVVACGWARSYCFPPALEPGVGRSALPEGPGPQK